MKGKILSTIGKYRWLFLIYFAVSVFIFLKLFLAKGAVLGGDWAFPNTYDEINNNFHSLLSSWTQAGNFLGTRQVAPVSILFALLLKLLAFFKIHGDLSLKLILTLIFAFSASNLNLLLRYFKISLPIALIGGFIYILSPIFFNYALMGWLFVLLALALLPLVVYLYLLAVETNQLRYALITAIIISVAMLQSQSIIWFPLVLLIILLIKFIKNESPKIALKMFIIILAVFALLNIYWLPGLLLFPDRNLTNSDLVTSSISLGTTARLSSANILRLWGSLFNYQFESSYPPALTLVSFILPLLTILGIYFRRKNNAVIYFAILFILPFLIYLLPRDLLVRIPFSAVIRDIARFAVLSTFASAVLVAFFLDYLVEIRPKKTRLFLYLLIFLLFLNTNPFWLGKLYQGEKYGYDFRFRTKEMSAEAGALEKSFQNESDLNTALFLPIGGMISSSQDQRYHGSYQEMSDVLAGYSKVAGVVYLSDRNLGVSGDLTKQIDQAISANRPDLLKEIISRVDLNYIVFRRDANYFSPDLYDNSATVEKLLNQLVSDGLAKVYFDQRSLLVLKIDKPAPLFAVGNSPVEINQPVIEVAKNVMSDLASELITGADQDLMNNYFLLVRNSPTDQVFAIKQQNQSYSYFSGQDPVGRIDQFVALEKLNDLLLLKKWKLLQQNLNQFPIQPLSAKDEILVQTIDNAKLDQARDKYATVLEQASAQNQLYLRPKTDSEKATIEVNGKAVVVKNKLEKSGLLVVDNLSLDKGLNIITTSDCEPIYLQELPVNLVKNDALPKIEVEKLSETRYRLNLRNVSSDFTLVFNQNFNNYWDLCSQSSLFCQPIISASDHFVANGYANGWTIKISDLKSSVEKNNGSQSYQIYLNFRLQKWLIVGSLISTLFLAVSLLFIFHPRLKKL